MREKIGIVVVNYQGIRDTLLCLDSLKKIEEKSTVAVVNVESEDEEELLKKHPLKVEVFASDNRGFSAANNLGIKRLIEQGCSTIVLLNNDTVVDANFLKPLLRRLDEPQVGMVSPLIYFAKGREYHYESYKDSERGKVVWYAGGVLDMDNVLAWHWGVNEVDHGQFSNFTETDFATGCCLAIRADVIEKIGLLDEKFFLYMEDVDWSVRAKKAGYKIGCEPRSIIWHVNAGSTGGSGSEIQQYYQTKSRLLIAKKYARIKTRLALWREGASKRASSKAVGQAYRDVILGRYGKKKVH